MQSTQGCTFFRPETSDQRLQLVLGLHLPRTPLPVPEKEPGWFWFHFLIPELWGASPGPGDEVSAGAQENREAQQPDSFQAQGWEERGSERPGTHPAGPQSGSSRKGKQETSRQTDISISVCAEGREEEKAGSRIDPIGLARGLSVSELIREGFLEEMAFELSNEGWKEEYSRQRAQHEQRS